MASYPRWSFHILVCCQHLCSGISFQHIKVQQHLIEIGTQSHTFLACDPCAIKTLFVQHLSVLGINSWLQSCGSDFPWIFYFRNLFDNLLNHFPPVTAELTSSLREHVYVVFLHPCNFPGTLKPHLLQDTQTIRGDEDWDILPPPLFLMYASLYFSLKNVCIRSFTFFKSSDFIHIFHTASSNSDS